MLLTLRYGRETPRLAAHGIDLPGQIAAILALGSLATGTIEGGALGWTSPVAAAAYATFVLASIAFVVIETQARSPMLPLALFKRPTFSAATAIGLMVNLCFYGLIFVFSLLFQREQGRSALDTGLTFLPMTAAIMLANILAGRLARSISPRSLILLGLAIMIVACAGLLGAGSHSTYPSIGVQMIALGAGVGLVVPPMTSSLLGSADRARSGIASGTLNSVRQTGSVIGVALFGSLIANVSHFDRGLHLALGCCVAVLLVATLAASRIATPQGSVAP